MGLVGARRLGVAIAASASLLGVTAASAAAHQVLVRPAPAVGAPMNPFGRLSNDTVTSTNWSGYAVAANSKFTDVKGSWVEPAVTCSQVTPQYSSFWAGIDGYTSDSVEQLGTDSDCDGVNQPSYYAWYEMYPAGSVDLSPAQYPVKAGDTLSAEVSAIGPFYTLTLHSSEGWTFKILKLGFGLSDSSAELIAESPEICGLVLCHLASLSNFGTVQFSNVEAATVGAADSPFDTFTSASGPHDIIAVTALGVQRAVPSPLTSSPTGDSFGITWEHS